MPPVDSRLQAMRNKAIEKANLRIRRHTIPLYGFRDGEKRSYKAATAVLIEFKGKKYLLTASHVHDHTKDNGRIGFWFGDQFKGLRGRYSKTDLPENEREDTLDFSVWLLSKNRSDLLEAHDYIFFPVDPTDKDITIENPSGIIVAGFPNSRQYSRFNSETLIQRTEGYHFASEMHPQFSNEIDIAVHWDMKEHVVKMSTGAKATPVNPNGMSGCGIWHLPTYREFSMEDTPLFLVGILRKYQKENKVILGNWIKELFPHLEELDKFPWPFYDKDIPLPITAGHF